ncbi:MAG: endonuclease/exonuclease/phosphatase family protein [Verrucomicrobiaceae bacterium]
MRTLLLLFLSTFLSAADTTICTFNIRFAAKSDKDLRAWTARRNLVAATIKDLNPDILGLQEVLASQLNDLTTALPHYAPLGVGREDGKTKGEFSPILYRKDTYTLIDHGTFWLSDTPDVPGSMTWDNVCERICTWANLKRKSDGKLFAVYNTHWDHRGQQSRLKSADLILSRLKKSPDSQLILMGDFNATETNPALQKLTAHGLTNAYLSLHLDNQNRNTFHPWNGHTKGQGTIDHIFLSGSPTIKKSWIDHTQMKTMWPSDHFPVATILAD